MKRLLQNKIPRICVTLILSIIVILIVFRIPTRLSAARFNEQTDLPIGLLEKGADWSDYTILGGFGTCGYLREGETGSLKYYVSNWPDAIFGTQMVDYIICRDASVTICGFSVGDDITQVEDALRELGFWKTRNDHQYQRFGVIITCNTVKNSMTISEIVIAVGGTNILGVVF